jgi:hypothetical protein
MARPNRDATPADGWRLPPAVHSLLWAVCGLLMLAVAVLTVTAVAARVGGEPVPAGVWGLDAALAGLLVLLVALWRRTLFEVPDLRRLLHRRGGVLDAAGRDALRGRAGDLRVVAEPWDDPVRPLARTAGGASPVLRSCRVEVVREGDFGALPAVRRRVDAGSCFHGTSETTGDAGLDRALERAVEELAATDFDLHLQIGPDGLRVAINGGSWMGTHFGTRIAKTLDFTERLLDGLAGRFGGGPPARRPDSPAPAAPSRPLLAVGFAPVLAAGLILAAAPAAAQPVAEGVAWLLATQAADGGWDSPLVRRGAATAEALRALQASGTGAAARGAGADLLALGLDADTDARARSVLALAGEGRDVSVLAVELADARGSRGGWGLTPEYTADPLDTGLALEALADRPEIDPEVRRQGLTRLLASQRDDGGFPCVESGDDDPDSEIYCTSQALLALIRYRGVYFLDPQIAEATAYLHGRRAADGSFGAPGPDAVLHTAVASLALAAVPSFGQEVAAVQSFLAASQQADGSWQGDPYTTALAVRALDELALVPYCGDGLINQPGESCDAFSLGTQTCEGLGLGAGTLSCSAQCTFDTSACSAPPVCGDGVRNQPFEVCDGGDLGDASCVGLGYSSGTLDCAADCLSFDAAGCVSAPTCGDGVVNQASESCDLSDLNGTSCETLGLGGGLLGCTADCNFATAQCETSSFVVDNKGREFVLGFLRAFSTGPQAALHLTSETPASVTIQYPLAQPTFVTTVDLVPGSVRVVSLPSQVQSSWPAGQVRSNAVRASSDQEFVAYMVTRQSATSDAGMALPVDALGTSYVVTTYAGSRAHGGDRAEFLVAAPFDNTTVTIDPSAGVRTPTGAITSEPFTVVLGRGDGFRGEAVGSRDDLTGTTIEADRPVFVVNGNLCTNVPSTTVACDHVYEVAHPVSSWGTSALVANLPNRTAGSVYRVVASVDGTEIHLDGVLQTVLDRGGFLELGPLPGHHQVTGSEPIFVTQFMTGDGYPGATSGDPAMANMIPPDQYLDAYTFSTVGGSQFSSHFLTVIAADSSVGSVLLDGAPIPGGAFTPLPTGGYSAAVLPLPEGSHTTSAPEPHGITVEGLNSFDSYVYPGGAQLEFINQFCGDGVVNLASEECDGNDFGGATCGTFGFAAGSLACSAACRVDTDGCSGVDSGDDDGDGHPSVDDCDDSDPAVHPGATEVAGNGVDDDCNPATPDTVPGGVLACSLVADQVAYDAGELVRLDGAVENLSGSLSMTGLEAALSVSPQGGAAVHGESRELAPLPPGARAQSIFSLPAAGLAAGVYEAELGVLSGGALVTTCTAGFSVEGTAATGAGLAGDLMVDPAEVQAGDSTTFSWTLQNTGNDALAEVAVRVLVLDAATGAELAELTDQASLAIGGGHAGSAAYSSAGLDPDSYLVVLLATPAPGLDERSLDSEVLTVVNVPPDCSAAFAEPAVLWSPNHEMVAVTVGGIVDPDGDPVTVGYLGVAQDEPLEATGDGSTCADAAVADGGGAVQVRAERTGHGDGRVYHVRFLADDGRGGTCEGSATVCVPRDRRGGGSCTDQGPLFDSTVCP